MKDDKTIIYVTVSTLFSKSSGVMVIFSKSFKTLEAAVGSMTLDYFNAIKSREDNGHKVESQIDSRSAKVVSTNDELHWEVQENELK